MKISSQVYEYTHIDSRIELSLASSNQSLFLQHSPLDMSINATDLTVDAMLRAFYKEKEHSEYFESLSQPIVLPRSSRADDLARRRREERLAIHRHRGILYLETGVEGQAQPSN